MTDERQKRRITQSVRRGGIVCLALAALLSGCGGASPSTPSEQVEGRQAQAKELSEHVRVWTRRGKAAEADLEDAIYEGDHADQRRAEATMRRSLVEIRAATRKLEDLLVTERARVKQGRSKR